MKFNAVATECNILFGVMNFLDTSHFFTSFELLYIAVTKLFAHTMQDFYHS